MKTIEQKEASRIMVMPQSSGDLIVLLQKSDAVGVDKQGAIELIKVLQEWVGVRDQGFAELKTQFDAYLLVEENGGLKEAKQYIDSLHYRDEGEHDHRLRQAIKIVESVSPPSDPAEN